MKLASLFRPTFQSALPARRRKPQVSEETLFKRKEMKRLKYVNQLDNDETNEKILEMMTQKKIKQLGLVLEKESNMNPQLAPIDPKIRDEIKNKFSKHSDYHYYQFRNQQLQVDTFKARKQEWDVQSQTNTLPKFLLKELNEIAKIPLSFPVVLSDNHLYQQQYKVMLPDSEYHKVMSLERIERNLEVFAPGE